MGTEGKKKIQEKSLYTKVKIANKISLICEDPSNSKLSNID